MKKFINKDSTFCVESVKNKIFMNLSSKSLHTRFYKWAFGLNNGWKEKQLTKNFCNYFWGLVLVTLLSPLLVFSLVLFWDKPDSLGERIKGSILGIMIILFSAVYILAFIANPGKTGLYTGIGISVVAALAGILFICAHFDSQGAPESIRVITEGIKSTKEKYCPKISWDDETSESEQK